MRVVLLMLAAAASAACGLVRAYSVEPRTAAQSGWTDTAPGQDYVSQIVTCCWDSLDGASGGYADVFAGAVGNGGNYNLDVYDEGGGLVASHHGVAAKEHNWVRFNNLAMQPGQSFMKGRQYEFRFTRSGQDSLEYYFDDAAAYPYGYVVVGGQDHTGWDLAMRVRPVA